MLQVTFESSSEVFGTAIDNPRGIRPWRGTLEVEGATVTGVRRTGLDNPLRDRLEWDAAARRKPASRSSLAAAPTRSCSTSTGDGAQTKVHIRLEAAKEAGAASTLRPLHDIPAADVTLALDDLDERPARARDAAGRRARRSHRTPGSRTDAPLDQKLEYTDLDAKGDGDYYYVRVTQLDGARAWTSPFWVGGKSGRASDQTAVKSF